MEHRVCKSLSCYTNMSLMIRMLLFFSGFSVGFCIYEEKVICYQPELGNKLMFRLNAPVVTRVKDDWNIQSKCQQAIFQAQAGNRLECYLLHVTIVQDWMCACQGACMDTLTIALYSLDQSTRVTPMSHLLEKVFTHSQLQDASPGWEQGFTQVQYHWWDLLLSAAGLVWILFPLVY